MKQQTLISRAMMDMLISFSHNEGSGRARKQVFNVSVTQDFEYKILKMAIVRRIRESPYPEGVICSRVIYGQPEIEVRTIKAVKLFIIQKENGKGS